MTAAAAETESSGTAGDPAVPAAGPGTAAGEDLAQRAAAAEKECARLRSAVQRAHILLAAQKVGVIDPDAAWRLLDASAITLGEDGAVTNAEDLIHALVREKPYLMAPGGGAAGSGMSPANPGRGRGGSTPTFTRGQLRDFDFYQANRAAIEQAAREGRIIE